MIVRQFVLAFLLFTVTNAALAEPKVATWPQWRGPTRDGVVPSSPAWPATLTESNFQKIWRVEDLGPSYSGVVVAEDRIFITETVEKKDEFVRALDRKTGRELWKTSWAGALTVPFFAAENGGWIRSTPAYDGESLYVAGIRDVLVCLDAKTGMERWKVDFVKEYATPVPAFGFVCSPLVDDKAVYVQAGAAFFKLDKKTGKVVWKSLQDAGGMNGSAFSSPVFAKILGKDQLLVQGRDSLSGVDPANGDVLWSRKIPTFRGMNILTPIQYGEDKLLTSTYGGKTMSMYLKSEEGKFSVGDSWTQKHEGYMSTPVIVDGHAYIHLKSRRIMCLDLADGKECWMTEKAYGRYWSLVTQKDKILALDERGVLMLIRATPEKFDVIGEIKLPFRETWAHIAIAGDEVFIRDLQGVTAYRWR